jgi:hypothetical protein
MVDAIPVGADANLGSAVCDTGVARYAGAAVSPQDSIGEGANQVSRLTVASLDSTDFYMENL